MATIRRRPRRFKVRSRAQTFPKASDRLSAVEAERTVKSDQLLVGVDAIAAELGQPVRRIRHWLSRQAIDGVRQISRPGQRGLYAIGRNRLRRQFGLSD